MKDATLKTAKEVGITLGAIGGIVALALNGVVAESVIWPVAGLGGYSVYRETRKNPPKPSE